MVSFSLRRAHIIYAGTVQGVGFRWTVESAARSEGLTGWVRNMPDGGVEVACEGTEERILRLTKKIKDEMGSCIRSDKLNWEKPTGEFSSFTIRFF